MTRRRTPDDTSELIPEHTEPDSGGDAAHAIVCGVLSVVAFLVGLATGTLLRAAWFFFAALHHGK